MLIVGGVASGKRTFADRMGCSACVFDVHEQVRRRLEEGGVLPSQDTELIEYLLRQDACTCAEVGSGVVPVDAFERAYRDEVGRLCALLANRADVVVRMVCGIPTVLKGELQ